MVTSAQSVVPRVPTGMPSCTIQTLNALIATPNGSARTQSSEATTSKAYRIANLPNARSLTTANTAIKMNVSKICDLCNTVGRICTTIGSMCTTIGKSVPQLVNVYHNWQNLYHNWQMCTTTGGACILVSLMSFLYRLYPVCHLRQARAHGEISAQWSQAQLWAR